MKKLKDGGRILLHTTGGQDYMQDDLLYGFRNLFGERAVDYPRKDIMYSDFDGQVHPRPEYAMNARYFANDPIDRNVILDPADFDLVINLSCRRSNRQADIYVDGEDDMEIHRVPGTLFKREIAPTNYTQEVKQYLKENVHPITFGLPDHLTPILPFTRLFSSKSIEVHSSFTVKHGPNRRRIAAEFPVEFYPTRAAYMEAINESKFVLSPKGAGWDCQRHYEILGRAVPIVEVNSNAPKHFQEMWRDGENCLTFDADPAIIREKVAAVTSKQWDDMINCGYDELHKKYTATAVAWKLLQDAGVV